MKTYAVSKWDGQKLSFLDTDSAQVLAKIIADARMKGQRLEMTEAAQERVRARVMKHLAGEEVEAVLRLRVRLRELEDELENAKTELVLKDEAYLALRGLLDQWAPPGTEMVK